MDLTAWATRWNIPREAIQELFYAQTWPPVELSRPVVSESGLQSLVRLEGARKDVVLWRNNNGALQDKTGRLVRFGLANDNKESNDTFKSGDLIGIRKRLIVPSDVGSILGQFVSRETKRPDWRWSGTPRELAQLSWATFINSYGGDAAIVNSEGSL